jgi:hypothetical protein
MPPVFLLIVAKRSGFAAVFNAVDHLQIVSLVVNELGHIKLHGF